MALDLTLGTGNSYISEVEYVDNVLAWYGEDIVVSPAVEANLKAACLLLNGLDWIGTKAARDNSLSWPRAGVFAEGFEYLDTEIPAQIRQAQTHIAYNLGKGALSLTETDASAVKRERAKAAVVEAETEYKDNARIVSGALKVEIVKALIKPFLRAQSGAIDYMRG